MARPEGSTQSEGRAHQPDRDGADNGIGYVVPSHVRAIVTAGGCTLIDTRTLEVRRFNDSAALIWEHLSTARSAAWRAELARWLGVGEAAAEAQVVSLVGQLVDGGWLLPPGDGPIRLASAPRRQPPPGDGDAWKLSVPRWTLHGVGDEQRLSLPALAKLAAAFLVGERGRARDNRPAIDIGASLLAGVPVSADDLPGHPLAAWMWAVLRARRMTSLFQRSGSPACADRLRHTRPLAALRPGLPPDLEVVVARGVVVRTRAALRALGGIRACFADSFAMAAALRSLGHRPEVVVGHGLRPAAVATPLHAWVECRGQPVSDRAEVGSLHVEVIRYGCPESTA
jgi:hypothetical protein